MQPFVRLSKMAVKLSLVAPFSKNLKDPTVLRKRENAVSLNVHTLGYNLSIYLIHV